MSSIKAFGAYLPQTIVTNDHLAPRLGCDPEWIIKSSGIRERRQASAEDTLVAMAARAGQDCLHRAGTAADQIGMLIVATGTASRRFPGPAAEVAVQLGLSAGTASLDVPMASAGSLGAMVLANGLAESYGNVLVVAAEKMTDIVWREPADPNTAILFGDGAGACLISRDGGIAVIQDSVLHSDGSFAGDLRLEHDGTFAMEGRSVIMQAARKIPAAITELLQRAGWSANDVDVLLMHQANQNLMNRVAQAAGLASDRVFSIIEKTGNTSSASMLLAASAWAGQQSTLSGKRMAFAAFGAGFHWGGLLATGV